jgi:hypothetical protein
VDLGPPRGPRREQGPRLPKENHGRAGAVD